MFRVDWRTSAVNRAYAIKATKTWAIATGSGPGLGFAVIIIAIYTDPKGQFSIFNDRLNYFDVALVLICSYGVWRDSRAVGIVLFVYFSVSRIPIYLTSVEIVTLASEDLERPGEPAWPFGSIDYRNRAGAERGVFGSAMLFVSTLCAGEKTRSSAKMSSICKV